MGQINWYKRKHPSKPIEKNWPVAEVIYGRSPRRATSSSPKLARSQKLVVQEKWPWLGPKSASEWESDYHLDQIENTSRYDYFKNTVRDELKQLDIMIDHYYQIWFAKEADRLMDNNICELIDYFNIDVKLVTRRNMKEMAMDRKLKKAVLEKTPALF